MTELYETAFSDFKVEALFTPKADVLTERYSLYVKPNFDTACWTFTPPHRIFLGDKVLKRIKPHSSEDEKVEYLKKYLWHEYAHACFTERDFERANAELSRIRAPFEVYNRFEDIRIEHFARKRWDSFKFEWSRFEDLKPVKGSSGQHADAMLFLLTQLEGDIGAVRKLVADQALFEEVLPFYKEACECRTSIALMPVIDRWLRKFPELRDRNKQAELGLGDLPLSAALSLVPGALEEFMSDAVNMAAPDDAQMDSLPEYSPNEDASRDGQQGIVLGSAPARIDDAEVSQVTDLLSNLFAKRTVKVSTATPTKKVSIRHHLMGRGPYRRVEEHGKKRKKVGVVVDCSGSMGGFHIASARVLVQALSMLAEAGAVEGYIVLSKISSQGPVWERFTLPMSRGAIERIAADGAGEGLAPTLLANRSIAAQMDLLLVYTDGNITDAPLDKKWLHSLGVFTWGVYVGKAPEAAARLTRYFDRILIRSSVTQLVQDLILTL